MERQVPKNTGLSVVISEQLSRSSWLVDKKNWTNRKPPHQIATTKQQFTQLCLVKFLQGKSSAIIQKRYIFHHQFQKKTQTKCSEIFFVKCELSILVRNTKIIWLSRSFLDFDLFWNYRVPDWSTRGKVQNLYNTAKLPAILNWCKIWYLCDGCFSKANLILKWSWVIWVHPSPSGSVQKKIDEKTGKMEND